MNKDKFQILRDFAKSNEKPDKTIYEYVKEVLDMNSAYAKENQELKKQLKIKHDGFMASVEESCELAEENQKYKEVIDKAIEYINLIVLGETLNGEPVLFKEEAEGQYLLDVLKEVE